VKRYEFIEHTADIAIKAHGADLSEAFAAAAEAMFAIITDNAAIEPKQRIELTMESIDTEGLLVRFLSELIVIHEVEELVLTDFEVSLSNDRHLTVRAMGEPFDAEKHGGGTPVKGVSYHMMEIADGGGKRPAYVQVLFDI
jgi:SHS2 domain-containing protein